MKKLIAVLLTLCLIASFLPATVLAAESQKISLEEAIKIAKSHFQPGKEYDQFDSSYEQSDYANVWSLRWYSSKEHGKFMFVSTQNRSCRLQLLQPQRL